MANVWFAFGLTLFAGLATGIGSIIAFFAKRTNYRFLSVSTGFSAGVMLYVSFVEILAKGADALAKAYGARLGDWINAASFFGGIALIAVIDNLIPSGQNPHESKPQQDLADLHRPNGEALPGAPVQPATQVSCPAALAAPSHEHLLRMGLFTALAIAIHNLPEGLAAFLATLQDPGLGVAIAIAIALHNIPEGISVSVPIYYATGRRSKAFIYSVMSGLSEPIGAGIAYLGLRWIFGGQGGVIPPQVMGVLFGGVAGIMVYISLDELLPTSRAHGKGHDSLLGLVAGMGIMALSLLIM